MMDYRDMTIWQLKVERDKINAELELRTNVRASPSEAESEAEHLRMQIGYLAGELQIAGDKRSTPEIVENAARATSPNRSEEK
jgi:hypothetical protein